MNNKILTISFVFILLSCALINILTPSQSFSVNENRYLQQFPQFSWEKIFNGTFTEQFAQYTTDQFPLRDIWIGAKTQTEKTLGKKDNGRVFFGKDDYLFAKDTPADPTLLQNNLQAIEQFVEKTSQKNPQISFSLLLAPTSASVLEDKLPPLAPIIPQELLFQDIQKNLAPIAPLAIFFPQAILQAQTRENLYYHTDHHWSSHGAFYAYQDWAKKLGLHPLEKDDFTIQKVSDSFYGTLYSKANLLHAQADTIEIYLPKKAIAYQIDYHGEKNLSNNIYQSQFLEEKDQYAYFLGGNHPRIDIQTSLANGKNLLLFKDSYANCFIPFLINHFQQITVIDLRYYKKDISAIIQERPFTHILFLYNIINFTEDKNLYRLNAQ